MSRKKVKLAFIANNSSRKATLKKRKKGLMKKVKELSTLCGVTACAIIYSPNDTNPEVWPSNSGVEMVVSEFRTLPEMAQNKKMVDQETFLRQRIAKATEQLRKHRKENRELEMTEIMFQSLVGNMEMFHLNILDLNDLGYIIDQYLKDINHRREILQNSSMEIGESSNAAAVEASSEGTGSITVVASTTVPTTTINEVGSSSSAATFFNPFHHQQFRHPAAPYVGLYEQHWNLNLNHHNHQNNQQWFSEMVNHSGQLSSAPAELMGFPIMDNNHHNRNHYATQEIFFTKNGGFIGSIPKDIKGDLFPTVAVHSRNEEVNVNFGKNKFAFDIKGYEASERNKQQMEIEKTSVPPNIGYGLVKTYLLHYGYEETLDAFNLATKSMIPPINIDQDKAIDEDDSSYALKQRKTLRQVLNSF